MSEIDKKIASLYKDKYGQLVSLLLQKFNSLSIEIAEDVVQDAFAEAAVRWPLQGVPQNASGWLYRVCTNKSINLLKKTARTTDLSSAAHLIDLESEVSEDHFKDAQLLMLVACCHPHLAPKAQVVLALKYVANFK